MTPHLVRLFSALLLCAVMAPAQKRNAGPIDMPEDPDFGIYYKTNQGWEEMLAEVVNWKTGGVLKRTASAGIVKGDINGHVNLAHSRNLITPPTAIIIYPPEGTSVTEYQLLRLHRNSGSREFRTITGGVVHESGGADRDTLQFEVKRLARGVYQVFLPNLADGEYGFLAPGAVVSREVASLGKIYTFRIGIPRGSGLTTDARMLTAPAATPPAVKPMTNGDVLELKAVGFSDDLVISKINSSPGNYQLDTQDILALKQANISDPVIQAMLAPSRAPEQMAAPGAATQAAPPANPVAAGVGDPPRAGIVAKLKEAFADPFDDRKPPAAQSGPVDPPAPSQSALTSVTITSRPAGARISVNGYTAGVTPSVVKLPPGTYKLTLQAEGYPAYSQQITIEPGQASTVGVVLDPSK